jgi:hypothetical protein
MTPAGAARSRPFIVLSTEGRRGQPPEKFRTMSGRL